MQKARRRALTRVLQWVAIGLVAADALLYLTLVRPIRRLVASERQTRDLLQERILDARTRVERLRKYHAALPTTDAEVKAFLRKHVPSRRRGFSRAVRLVRRLTEQSGLELNSVSYRLGSGSAGEPLERLGIDVTVEGSFPGLLRFAHALETGEDFVLVHDFSFQPGEGDNVALRLVGDLFLEP